MITSLSSGNIWIWLYSFVFIVVNGVPYDISGTEILIQGDIMVDVTDDWDRQASFDMKQKRWPNGVVPYQMNSTVYSEWDEYVILKAMEEIEESTCVTFVERTYEEDYIYISPLGGCWSYMGRKGSHQTLSLVVPECINVGTVIHELMHSLGFWHEHTRADRDQYVEVLWDNVISEEKKINFAKQKPIEQDLQFPYDYKSVMHYNAWVFSKASHLPTLKPTKRNIRLSDLGRAKTIGTLTDTDKLKVNALYECQ